MSEILEIMLVLKYGNQLLDSSFRGKPETVICLKCQHVTLFTVYTCTLNMHEVNMR